MRYHCYHCADEYEECPGLETNDERIAELEAKVKDQREALVGMPCVPATMDEHQAYVRAHLPEMEEQLAEDCGSCPPCLARKEMNETP